MNLCLRQPEYNVYGDGDGLLGEELNIHDEVKLAAKMGKSCEEFSGRIIAQAITPSLSTTKRLTLFLQYMYTYMYIY